MDQSDCLGRFNESVTYRIAFIHIHHTYLPLSPGSGICTDIILRGHSIAI